MVRLSLATINNWRVLSLKRLAHLDELRRSGRWEKLFASKASFDEALEQAEANMRKWRALADEAVSEAKPARSEPSTV